MTDLLKACPGLALWLERRQLWRSMWQPENELELQIAARSSLHVRLGAQRVVVRSPLAPLPQNVTSRSQLLREALTRAGALLGETSGGLAVDPARQQLWWQDTWALNASEPEVDAALAAFLDTAQTLGDVLPR
ncbi:type III secretion system chaperone [Paraburkholderia agricolaris]|uniref:type III secretion system chaperone n=1 Tax=Paraburkholderia agricolaris TaxID=2152888 RepID=UPI001290C264|nr:type III secretion system chaperone [Paraburkholderia agricolaris]